MLVSNMQFVNAQTASLWWINTTKQEKFKIVDCGSAGYLGLISLFDGNHAFDPTVDKWRARWTGDSYCFVCAMEDSELSDYVDIGEAQGSTNDLILQKVEAIERTMGEILSAFHARTESADDQFDYITRQIRECAEGISEIQNARQL